MEDLMILELMGYEVSEEMLLADLLFNLHKEVEEQNDEE